MMDQPTFADLEYNSKKRKTRREISLSAWIAWFHGVDWKSAFARSIPRRGEADSRMSCLRCCGYTACSYSTISVTLAWRTYSTRSESVRRFVGLRLSGPLPDETTILNFRHLLEEHQLGDQFVQGDQPASGVSGAEAAGGNDSGCEHNRGAVVNEE